jgi:protein gp37
MAKRLKGMGQAKYQTDGDPRTSGPGFGLAVHPAALDVPLRRRKPTLWFVNSMSDLFHDRVPDEFIARVFAVMAIADWHTYQALTKRHGRLRSLLNSRKFATAYAAAYDQLHADLGRESEVWRDRLDSRLTPPWPIPNLWLGVSVEDQKWADIRIPALLDTPAAVRFLSCEPLLGEIDFRGVLSHGISWAIIGGESGPEHRPMDVAWLAWIVGQCADADVAVWTKQDSGPKPGRQGRIPDSLWLHRFPEPLAVASSA